MTFDTTTLYIIAFIISVILLIWYFYRKREEFDEDTTELDNTDVLEECKTMTAEKMFKLFNEDLNYLTQVFVDNNIPLSAIKNLDYYPKIASLLVKRGILKCA